MKTCVLKRCVLGLIRGYQILSRLLPHVCRFYPSCSTYMAQAISGHGLGPGIWLGVKRLCRCHPLNPGGVDPVPTAPKQAQQKVKV